jgi:ribokinase
MHGKILVIGSSNTDMVVKTRNFPNPGETVLGGTFMMHPGGKGANQAVAAARLGGDVRFVAKLGEDTFGAQALDGLKKEGLDVGYMCRTPQFASGVALITVNAQGENEIVVASGANMELTPDDLPDVVFREIDLVLIQLEIPLETVTYIIRKCTNLNIRTILNPAPATQLDDLLLRQLYLITPNETETEISTGIMPSDETSLRRAAQFLRDKGVGNVIITLGKRGVYLLNDVHDLLIPAPEVIAIDTTAAGDVFNGAIATALSKGKNWITACELACQAAALSVTRPGAQSSAPYASEIKILN